MHKLAILALLLVLFAAGCAHNISEPSLALVDRTITFSMLRANPDAYRGKFVLLGGSVAEVTRTGQGLQLEVEQHDLGSRETPDLTSVSGGRFLATAQDTAQAANCRSGTPVSMVGEVTGKRVKALQGTEYTYPVIAVKELSLFASPGESLPGEGLYRTWGPYGGF